MTAFERLVIEISNAADTQVKAFQTEIEQQGHVDTRRLYNSIDKKILQKLGGIIRGEITTADYGLPVSDGVPAAKVNYNPFWLLGWAGRKRPELSDKELKSFVFAIWMKHKKTGIPSPGAYSFTSNGYRTKWIERGTKLNANKFNGQIRKALQRYAVDILEELLDDIRKSI